MAQVLIRNIDEQVMERLRKRAAERRQSLEQTLRDILAEAAKPSRQELLDELEACRALTPGTHRTSAQDIIREIRDEK
jgi:plasmid stability protein